MDNWNNKQKLIVQIVCLLLSIGLWFYVTNIENPIRTYELNRVPVELVNKSELKAAGLALSPNQQFYVNLKIEGNSQDLFSISKSDFRVIIDLSKFALKEGENEYGVSIVEAPSNIRIKNNTGLTIKINTEKYITKKVPVKSKIDVISKSSYYVATPEFDPSEVEVSGAESLVSKVVKVIAEGEESNAVETIVKNYTVTPVDENDNKIIGVELSEKWVEATISINEGKTVPIKINTSGSLPEGMRIESIKSSATSIGITGPQKILDSISEIGTEVIDLSQIKESVNVEVALGIPQNILIHNGENSITVSIAVEKVKTKEFDIGFSIKGEAAGLSVIPETETVKITVSAYEDVLEKLTEANFSAELDVSEYTEEGEYTKAPDVVIKDAENVSIDSIGEVKIQVLKDAPTSGEEVEELPQE